MRPVPLAKTSMPFLDLQLSPGHSPPTALWENCPEHAPFIGDGCGFLPEIILIDGVF
jgi:hypothetical protein